MAISGATILDAPHTIIASRDHAMKVAERCNADDPDATYVVEEIGAAFRVAIYERPSGAFILYL